MFSARQGVKIVPFRKPGGEVYKIRLDLMHGAKQKRVRIITIETEDSFLVLLLSSSIEV
jgi:hypothetical protein